MFSKVKLVLARWAAEFASLPRRLKQAIAVVVAIGLVIGAVFLGRTIHHHINQPEQTKRPTEVASQNSKPSSPSTPQKPATPNSSSTKSSGSTSNNSSSGSSSYTKSPSASSSTGSSSIPNTGPGDVAAIFAGVTVAGATLHYGLSRRRQNS